MDSTQYKEISIKYYLNVSGWKDQMLPFTLFIIGPTVDLTQQNQMLIKHYLNPLEGPKLPPIMFTNRFNPFSQCNRFVSPAFMRLFIYMPTFVSLGSWQRGLRLEDGEPKAKERAMSHRRRSWGMQKAAGRMHRSWPLATWFR